MMWRPGKKRDGLSGGVPLDRKSRGSKKRGSRQFDGTGSPGRQASPVTGLGMMVLSTLNTLVIWKEASTRTRLFNCHHLRTLKSTQF